MIRFLRGILDEISEDGAIIDVNGVGYLVKVTVGFVSEHRAFVGSEVKVYTYMHVREDLMELYGFTDLSELRFFQQLISVNGIGPKAALGIISSASISEIKLAIISQNAASLSKVPGIGKKTAEKIILELKDRIDISTICSKQDKYSNDTMKNTMIVNTIEALTTLGYTPSVATRALKEIEIENNDTEETLLKKALRFMSF